MRYFEACVRFTGQPVWQMRSADNVMGYGANKRLSMQSDAAPNALVQPYYLEYVRRHFCTLTHRKWRIGYAPE
ncbi:hypothetical protein DWU98_21455 [Dyella monticola]|uniref:Uncharacterized protein n=1 Tax=Dyella monticola TaxID=1927958 RepID=A0A370WRJ6_9GAMM|nr:hypothetical protein [Dyella monticola]RDS78721.1 hypothetical protein DWU98_21455 [Dyella monticola]